jgi:hypothetical protein
MNEFDENEMPGELDEVAKRLRDAQPTFSAVELDQLKLRTMAQASSAKRSGKRMPGRSRVVSFVLAAGLLGGTAATGIAATGGGNGGGNAASVQYKPPGICKKVNPPPGNPPVTCVPFTHP